MKLKVLIKLCVFIMVVSISNYALCEECHISDVYSGVFNTVAIDATCVNMSNNICELKTKIIDIDSNTLISAIKKYSTIDFENTSPKEGDHHSKKYINYSFDVVNAQLEYVPSRYITNDVEQIYFVDLSQDEVGQTFFNKSKNSPNCNYTYAEAEKMVSDFLSIIVPNMRYDFEIYPFILEDESNGGNVIFAHAIWRGISGCRVQNDPENQGEIEFRINNSGIYFMRGNVNWIVEEEQARNSNVLDVYDIENTLLENVDLLGEIIETNERIIEIRPIYYRALTLPVNTRILMPAYAIYSSFEDGNIEQKAICCIDAITGEIIKINDPFDQNG